MARISKDVSVLKRWRYYFDNSISRGPSAFVAWLAIFGILLSVLITAIDYVLNGFPKGTTANSALTHFGATINTVLFGGAVPQGRLLSRFIAILIWISAITISATIIGFITNKIKDRLEKLRSGRAPIIESGHTLVLGWSNRVFPIVQELCVANENSKKPLVVVVAIGAQDKLEAELADRIENKGKTRILVRAGDPTNILALQRANIAGASSIIVLDSNNGSDSEIISIVLAIKAAGANPDAPIVAEVDDVSFGEALNHATDGRIIPVHSNAIIARVTAQASRQPGLATVILDLLDFDGDEIYFQDVPEISGLTYSEALISFSAASIIGIQTYAGRTFINPAMATKINAGDKIIAIASDDDQIVYSGLEEELRKIKQIRSSKISGKKESLLFIGWSQMGDYVLSELAPFLPKGSSVLIIANPDLIDKASMPKSRYGSISVRFAANYGTISELAEVARKNKYDEIIVMAYREKITVVDADARTMLTMLLLNKLFDEDGNGIDRTRLVAEILDSRRAELARVANADDLVVSDNLAALLTAQLSSNPELAPVFEDIFDADGATINVNPIVNYARIGDNVRYLDLVAHARGFKESVIGYRSASLGVRLNPAKSEIFEVQEGDGLIVISELR